MDSFEPQKLVSVGSPTNLEPLESGFIRDVPKPFYLCHRELPNPCDTVLEKEKAFELGVRWGPLKEK